MKRYEVESVDGSRLTWVKDQADGRTVAFCARSEDAELVARALNRAPGPKRRRELRRV